MATLCDEDITKLNETVLKAAQQGDVSKLGKVLKDLDTPLAESILSHVTVQKDNQETTPLIAAAVSGNVDVVEFILNNWKVNLEQAVTITTHEQVVRGATALWCAAEKAQGTVVKQLLENGAQVNHCTGTNSSPVRVGCFDCDLELIRYFVEHGADIHIPNHRQSTCLMVASQQGRLDIVQFLVDQGADLNCQYDNGDTAMHIAATRGHLEIVKYFVSCGAKILLNRENLTPLMATATNCQTEVLDYLVSIPECSADDKLTALELIGASYEEPDDIENAFQYLKSAIQMRLDSPNLEPRQQHIPNPEVYGKQVECQTLEELEVIKSNPHDFFMNSLIIRERILGPMNIEIVDNILFRGAAFADSRQYQMCLNLWFHALKILEANNCSLTSRLLEIADLFAEMVEKVHTPVFMDVFRLLLCSVEQILNAEDGKVKRDVFDDEVPPFVAFHYSLVLALKLRGTHVLAKDVTALVVKFLKCEPKLSNRTGILHTVLDCSFDLDYSYMDDLVVYPSIDMCKFLVACGANVNAKDAKGNTPLHILALTSDYPQCDTSSLETCITFLIVHGCHPDARNAAGKTPLQCTNSEETERILKKYSLFSLKCLASTVVMKHHIPFEGEIPSDLEGFVRIH